MKRIVFVCECYGMETSGGTEQYTRLVAERLANRYEVEVLTTKAVDRKTWKDWYSREEEVIHGVTVHRFSVEELRSEHEKDDLADYITYLNEGSKSLEREHTYYRRRGPYTPALIQYLRKNSKNYDAFFFVGYHNYITNEGLPYVQNRAILIPRACEEPNLHFACTEMLMSQPAGFVFLTNEERLLVRRTFPKSEAIPCQVMGTGIDIPCQPDPDLFQRQYRITDPYIIYVGRIDEEKNCPMLFHYFLEYKKRNGGNLKLVLMGNQGCPIPENKDIIALGHVSEENKFHGLAGAVSLVLPSTAESLSLPVLEAMSVSVPVLVNGVSSVLRGHCVKSNAGLFYKNYFEFEGALKVMLERPEIRLKLCENARVYIRENYNWAKILRQFHDMIQRIQEKQNN